MLASFGQGSNSIKSAEQGAGLGLPIAKSLVDLHGGTFTLKSKLRVGTEVIVTFPPERVMSALAPMREPRRRSQPREQGEPDERAPRLLEAAAVPARSLNAAHVNHDCLSRPGAAYLAHAIRA